MGQNSSELQNVRRERGLLIILFAVTLLIISLIPIFYVQIPPLVDYPNHLARVHILINGDRSAHLREFYEIRWAVLPNLAMDLIVPVLAKFLPLEVAGKLFLGLIFLLMSGGTMALHYVLHRRLSLWPLLVFLFLYNRTFLWGFVNCAFGLALALWALAAWVRLRSRSPLLVIPMFSALNSLIFFSHLFALGFYALTILAYEAGQYWMHRKQGFPFFRVVWIKALAQFTVPVFLLVLSPSSASAHGITFSPFLKKLIGLAGTIRTYDPVLDGIAVVCLLSVFILGLSTKRLLVASEMYGPLAAVFLAILVMPNYILTGDNTDTRLQLPFVLLVIASTQVEFETNRWTSIVAGGFVILFLFRMGEIGLKWQEADRQYVEYLQAIDHLPEGSSLFSAVIYGAEGRHPFPVPVDHVSCLAVIKKSALCSTLFTFPATQMPIALNEPYRQFYSTPFPDDIPLKWDRISNEYDFVQIVRDHLLSEPLPSDFLPIFSGKNVALYKLPKATKP